MTEVFAWLALLILLVLIELTTMKAGHDNLVCSRSSCYDDCKACGAPVLVQVILFLVVSVLMLVLQDRLLCAISMLEGRRPMWTTCLGTRYRDRQD